MVGCVLEVEGGLKMLWSSLEKTKFVEIFTIYAKLIIVNLCVCQLA